MAFTPASMRYSARSSADFLVTVVISTRSPFLVVALTSSNRSSMGYLVSFTVMSGSRSPVGRIICSTISSLPQCSYSYLPGVAET